MWVVCFPLRAVTCQHTAIGLEQDLQRDGASATCDKKAEDAYLRAGGSKDAFAQAQKDGAMNKGTAAMDKCVDEAVAKLGVEWDKLTDDEIDKANDDCEKLGW